MNAVTIVTVFSALWGRCSAIAARVHPISAGFRTVAASIAFRDDPTLCTPVTLIAGDPARSYFRHRALCCPYPSFSRGADDRQDESAGHVRQSVPRHDYGGEVASMVRNGDNNKTEADEPKT